MTTQNLLPWGRYPQFPQTPIHCNWQGELREKLADARARHGTTLAFGAGRSYGDSCLAASGHVLHMRPVDRFLGVDWAQGVLRAESGVTLGEILEVAIPRGWFLAVTPGTKYVTLGGAIANDVHGKNHHRHGTFGRHVLRFGLLRSDDGRITCSPTENASFFGATIGGLGLTGVIEWAEIQLKRIGSSSIDQITQRFGNLDEFFALSRELDEQHEFCVSWVDCSAKGGDIGRGTYAAGDFISEGPLHVESGAKLTVPVTPPISLVNPLSVRAFNELLWIKAPRVRRQSTVGYDPFFYPLDGLLQWNRVYGPRGFQQYQAVIPERDAQSGIRALLSEISRSGTGSFLTVLKRCGALPSPGLLSFPMSGTTLALDFPQDEYLKTTLFPRLDAIVRETNGRLYPAKDAHMSSEDFKLGYPTWAQLEAARDPALLSRFWQRVTQ